MENLLHFPAPGDLEAGGICRDYLDFTLDRQLLMPKTWEAFVRVFTEDSDDADRGWRCEYWGKMMRGACLCFRATGNLTLYGMLRDSVRALLRTQRPDGRFSTYSDACQFSGWDLWGRKYVMAGLLHFLDICSEEELRREILPALIRHADAVIAGIGPGENQTPITRTSDFWGGVNSCSILEPFVELYRVTRMERYLQFARYILSTGGCRDGNLIRLAQENKIPPYRYPEVKAYETLSFFEGVLDFAQVTEDESLLRAAMNFFDSVAETDLTVIGCCGCTDELFDHSAIRQTEDSQDIMQETCVSVTWMRVCARLLMLTGDSRYYTFLERTGYNALYGAVNLHGQNLYDRHTKTFWGALPFDSYSPLTGGRRGQGLGGLKTFAFGGYYGCCACIASAGIALMPLTAVMQGRDGLYVNALFSGRVNFRTAEGKAVTLSARSAYPREGSMRLTVSSDGPVHFALMLRIPAFDSTEILLNGERVDPGTPEKGYVRLEKCFEDGDTVDIRGQIPLVRETIGGCSALRYGCIVLARDEARDPGFDEPAALGAFSWQLLPQEKGETVRIRITRENGTDLLLTDYASCGKTWNQEKSRVRVWMRDEA